MDADKKARLEAAGFRVGDAATFLDLSAAEAAFVDLKLHLAAALRARRTALGITQGALARRIGSSQSRVAKAEAADPAVSADLLLRALAATGGSITVTGAPPGPPHRAARRRHRPQTSPRISSAREAR